MLPGYISGYCSRFIGGGLENLGNPRSFVSNTPTTFHLSRLVPLPVYNDVAIAKSAET